VNSALLSRSRVYTLNPLTEEQVVALLERALVDEERGLGKLHLTARPEVLARIAAYSSGDARSGYNVLEIAATLAAEAGPKALFRRRRWRTRCRGARCVMTGGRGALQPDLGAA